MAATFGHVDCVRALCENPQAPVSIGVQNQNRARRAFRPLDLDQISREKPYGDASATVNTGTALFRACVAGHAEVARVLLEVCLR